MPIDPRINGKGPPPESTLTTGQRIAENALRQFWPIAGDVFVFGDGQTRMCISAGGPGQPYRLAGPFIKTLTLEEKMRLPPQTPNVVIAHTFDCMKGFPEPLPELGDPVGLVRRGNCTWLTIVEPAAETDA